MIYFEGQTTFFFMFRYILAGLLLGAAHGMTVPVEAKPGRITKGYHTMDAMGCMILRECTDGVKEVYSILDISSEYENTEEFTSNALEFNHMLSSLGQIGVRVFLADSKYFPHTHRGVYHTVSNNFYLNRKYMGKPSILMSVMRHEGWHAAQDCMAGTINNTMLAIIHNEEDVPMLWRTMAERTYPAHAVPWEAEAAWAGRTEGMTQNALESCARGTMWSDYELTPLTRKWLVEEGYIKE